MLMKSPDQYETFGPSDREYIANMIDHYLAGTVPDDYEDRERFLTDCECGFWIEETETGGDADVRIEHLTREAFEANPQLAIDIPWDDLVSFMYCHVLGVHYLEVIGDWRPDKLEYLRAVIADRAAKGDTIVYIDWPDGVERPVAGPTMNEFICERGKVMDKANDRNGTSAQKAVTIFPVGTTVKAGDRNNYGDVVSDDGGDTVTVHFVSKDGQHATKDIPRDQLRAQDGSPLDGETIKLPRIKSMRQMLAEYPELRPPVVEGLLRIGETGNIVANTKFGKSWLGLGLAFAVATGGDWLGTFRCAQGRVLLLDNELHPETIAHRLGLVASALGVEWDDDVADMIDAAELRGVGADLHGLAPLVDSIEAGHYQLVIADAWYRFIPPGVSENDNAQIMALYNRLDGYTGRMQSAWVNIHHASKGPQDGKTVTDVGAGAGAQSRAADTHIILRPHEEEDIAVMEAAVRSWRRVEPLSIKWEFPLWQRADDADPRQLRRQQTPKQRQQQAEDEATIGKIIAAFLGGKVHTARSLGGAVGIGKPRLERLLNQLQAAGRIISEETVKRGNTCYEYRLAPAERVEREHDQEPQCGKEPQRELFDDDF